MTGFGKATANIAGKVFTVEIRSVNSSKGLDLSLRLPSLLRSREHEIRKVISEYVVRGKVDVNIGVENEGEVAGVQINHKLIAHYFTEIKRIEYTHKIEAADYVKTLLSMPDVFKAEKDEITDSHWAMVKKMLENAVDDFRRFRAAEGGALAKDLLERTEIISSLLEAIEPHCEDRMLRLRERIQRSMRDAAIEKPDESRFEQEMIYYLEKFDITEEKVRLENHCAYFTETMQKEEEAGRKLGFICQEIGREINTIGSKANHFEIQQIVVQMKDELEKIKEQLANIL